MNAAAPGARRGPARLVRLLQRAARHQEEVRAAFDAHLEFRIKLIAYDGDDVWVEGALEAIRETLRAPQPPAVNGECEYCRFAAGAASIRSGLFRLFFFRKENQCCAWARSSGSRPRR